jgi:hypothetical protein
MATVNSMGVNLRPGITKGTLPNNIAMKPDKGYVISLEDYGKISQVVRDTVITSTPQTVNTLIPLANGTDYVLDLTDAAVHDVTPVFVDDVQTAGPKIVVTENVSATSLETTTSDSYFELGQVVQGFNGDAFMLVEMEAIGSSTLDRNVTVWSDKDALKVSVVTDDPDLLNADFAGITVAPLTFGNYGWIQISGTAQLVGADDDISAGDMAKVGQDPTTVGRVRSGDDDEEDTTAVLTFTGLSADGDDAEIVWDSNSILIERDDTNDGVTAGSVKYLTGTVAQRNATKAAVEAAFAAAGATVDATVPANYTTLTIRFITPDSPVSAITDGGGGAASIAIDQTSPAPGVTGTPNSTLVGTALTDAVGNVAEVELRSADIFNRHFKRTNLFYNKNGI